MCQVLCSGIQGIHAPLTGRVHLPLLYVHHSIYTDLPLDVPSLV